MSPLWVYSLYRGHLSGILRYSRPEYHVVLWEIHQRNRGKYLCFDIVFVRHRGFATQAERGHDRCSQHVHIGWAIVSIKPRLLPQSWVDTAR